METSIENIIDNGIDSVEDISTILSWKIGHSYKRDLNRNQEATIWGHRVNLQRIYEIVRDNSGKVMFDKLNAIQGLGPVYSATLLFFKSKMDYPIFDKYACVALDAVTQENEIMTKINYIYHSDSQMFWKSYLIYIEKLVSVFGTTYKENRTVDQALWAYGHLFDIVEHQK